MPSPLANKQQTSSSLLIKKEPTPPSWLIKFVDCAFVAIAVADFFDSMVAMALVSAYPQSRLVLYGIISTFLKIAGLIFVIGYPLYWRRAEKRGDFNSALRHAWFRGILRYWLAVEICNYGFAKILETQFAHVYFRADSLVGSLSGYDLTWNYFGYSYALAVIIALFQIGGSILLLFRRTTLLGTVVLLPVLVNVVLIDVFYGIAEGALMNAVVFTLGLTYLLLLRWKDLKAVFLDTISALPPIKLGWAKYVLRLFVVAYAFLFIWHFAGYRHPEYMTGKWQVEQIVRNEDTVKAQAWLTDSTAWKNIYLEESGRIYLSPNPYVFEAKRAQAGFYAYDDRTHTIKWIILEKADTFNVVVSGKDAKHEHWRLVHQKDTIGLTMTKAE